MVIVFLSHYGMMAEVQWVKKLCPPDTKIEIVPNDIDWNKIKQDTILIGSHSKLTRLPISRPIKVNGFTLCKVSALMPKWAKEYNQTLDHLKRGLTIASKCISNTPYFKCPVPIAAASFIGMVNYIKSNTFLNVDFETTSLEPYEGEVITVAVWNGNLKVPCYVYYGDCQPILELLIRKDLDLCACNAKFEQRWLLAKTRKEGNFTEDVQVTYALLYEEKMKGLDFIAGSIDAYGYEMEMESFLHPIEGLRKLDKNHHRRHHEAPALLLTGYCGKDVVVTGLANNKLIPLVFNSPGKMEDVRDWLVRGQTCLARMEDRGTPLSSPHFLKEEKIHLDRMEEIKFDINCVAADYMSDFDIGSSKKKIELLYNKMQLPVMMTTDEKWVHKSVYRKGWNGDETPSAGADALELVKDMVTDPEKVKFIELLIEYNQKQAVYDGLIKYCRDAVEKGYGCIRSEYSLTKLVTGQLSSANPPMQNVVKDQIRRIFRSKFKGGKVLELDHSQLHLRVMGNLAQCEGFIDAYSGGTDLHSKVARDIVLRMEKKEWDALKSKDEKKYDEARDKGKRTNFSIIFEIGPKSLAFRLNVPIPTAKGYILHWFDEFPEVEEQIERQHQFAKENGYVISPFGRIRHLPNAQSMEHNTQYRALRQAGDYLISNSGRYTTLYGMILMDEAMIKAKLKSYIFGQVHDSILVDVYPGERDAVLEIAQEHMVKDLAEMTEDWMQPIPFVVEGYWGDSWYKKDKEGEVMITREGVTIK